MILTPSCIIVLLGCSFVSALTLNLTSPISSPQALNATITTLPTDALFSNTRVTDLGVDPTCNGPETGVDLTDRNCHDAVAFGIPDVTEKAILNYGDRRFGSFDINIPQRYISGEYKFSKARRRGNVQFSTGDGRCVVDVTLKNIHKKTPYYPFGIALGAASVLSECVNAHNPPQGGTIEGFGTSSHR